MSEESAYSRTAIDNIRSWQSLATLGITEGDLTTTVRSGPDRAAAGGERTSHGRTTHGPVRHRLTRKGA